MAENEIGKGVVKIAMDKSGFNKSITDLNRQMEVVQQEFKTASTKMGGFGKSTEHLKIKSESLNKQIELQRKKVEQLGQKYEITSNKQGKDAKATQNANIQYQKAQQQLYKLENSLKATNMQIDRQTSKWTIASKKLDTVSTKFKNVGTKMSSIGKSFSVKVTAPLIALGTAASKTSIDFENGMAKVGTIADTTQVSLNNLGKGVISLSNDTGASVNELAEAEYQAISAGVDTANSVEFLETATKAAKGGFTDTTTSINGLTTVLNAYGMKANEVNTISDQMLTAQNFGRTSFGEMSQSIGSVIPIASSLNVSTEELFASIATLTKNGIQTSQAITGLKAAYSNILKPSKKAGELAEKLGLEFNAAHLKSVGWAGFLDEIKEKTGGNSEQMAKLFGSTEALNSVTVLAGKGSKDFANALNEMENSAGATDKAFEKMDDTTGNKLHKSLNKLKNSGIKLGNSLTPVIEKLSNIITNLADKFNALSPAQQKIIVKMGLLAVAIGPVIGVGGKLISTVGSIGEAFAKISLSIGKAGGILKWVASPAGIAVVAITGVVTVGILLYKNWNTVVYNLKKIWEDLLYTGNRIFLGLKGVILSFIDKTLEAISKVTKFIPGLNKKVNSTKQAIKNMVDKNVLEKQTEKIQHENKLRMLSYEKTTKNIKKEAKKKKENSKQLTNELSLNSKKLSDNVNSDIENTTNVYSEATRGIKANTVSAYNTISEKLNETSNNVQNSIGIVVKKLELWRINNNLTKDSAEYLAQQVITLKDKSNLLSKEINVTTEALTHAISAYGEGSNKALEYRNKLLDLQITQANLGKEIEETTDKMKEQHNTQISFSKDGESVTVGKVKYNVKSLRKRGKERKEKDWNKHGDEIKAVGHRQGVDYGVAYDMWKQNKLDKMLGNTPQYHSGGWVGNVSGKLKSIFENLKNDEVPAILQTGEFVLNRKMIDSIDSNISRKHFNNMDTTSKIENNFNIAELVIREEADIKKVARELYNLQVNTARAGGAL